MPLDFGHDAAILMATEGTYGTISASTAYVSLPVMSFDPGTRAPGEMQELAGLVGGRDGGVRVEGLRTIEPSAEVPLDLNNIPRWLRLLFGAPVTTGSTDLTHVYKSGAATLPSVTIEQRKRSDSFLRLLGVRADTMDLSFAPGTVTNMLRIGMVGTGRAVASSTVDASPVLETYTPLLGQTADISLGGSPLGSVTGGSLRFSNGLERLRTANVGIGIALAEPGVTSVSGSITVRMQDDALITQAIAGTSTSLSFIYEISATQSLTFNVPAAFLDLTDPPVRGRAGIQATFNFMGQRDATAQAKLVVTLKNQLAAAG